METLCLRVFLFSLVISICKCDYVKLVGGSSNLEGRVEILYNNTWGTVCDDLWGFYDAQVVCRQLGFPTAVRASNNAEFGNDATGPILLDNVQCVGTETDILECPHSEIGVHNCVHSEDAGVVCSTDFSLRLVNDRLNSTNENITEGVVEVYYNGVWGTICDDEWSLSEARVVCNQLGFERAIKAVHESVFAESTTPILMDQVVCTGEEKYLSSCSFDGWGVHDCSHSEDAGVVCSHPMVYHGDVFDVRLVDGPSQSEGRLEVLYNGTWGTVCDDRFTIVNAQIVCKQLGYLGAIKVYPRAHYGSGNGPITLDNVQCRGSEQLLSECLHLEFFFSDCSHSEDVGVVCSNESMHILPNVTVYLVGGHEVYEGRVEVEVNGTRGTVCHDYWDFLDAQVVCRQLGFPGALRATYSATFGVGTGPILLDNVECSGSETNLGQCDYWSIEEHNCVHEEDAGVVCLDKQPTVLIRLVAGSSSAEGRIELYYQGAWGTVCDDNWDYFDAAVVCRELGFPGAVSALGSDAFGPGSNNQRILLDNVRCIGTETDLLSCPHDPIGVSDCSHIEDASVICIADLIPPVRLVGGTDSNKGVVQVYLNETWGTVCGDQWTINEANVVCRQLGYSDATRLANTGEFDRANGPVLLQNVYCTGFESFLTSCVHDEVGEITIPSCQNHTGDVGVVCTGTPIFAPVRLVGSENSYEGRVEIRYSGVWGTICDEDWDSTDATVVCRMLGLSTTGAQGIGGAKFGEGIGQVWLSELECGGSEAELVNCQRSGFGGHHCPHSKDASVICEIPPPEPVYPVRLYGSSVSYEGVVEVSLNRPVGKWLAVCGAQFDFFDAEVVCRQLGYPGALRFYREDIFNISNVAILITELGCVGDENEVAECNITVTEVESCNSTATVFCREYTAQTLPVKLVFGSVISEGQLQVFHQGYWGYVCDTGFGIEEARVVCRQLGFPGAIRALLNSPFPLPPPDSARVWLSSLQCTGNESNVAECYQQSWGGSSCSAGHEVGVQCTAPANPIRLIGANSSTEGTVLIFRNDVWGTVCDDYWDIRDALVVCSQLGYPGVIEAVKHGKYGAGAEFDFLLDDVRCSGAEILLSSCRASEWGVHNCVVGEIAGAKCSAETKVPEHTTIRLVDGNNEFEGRIEILHEEEWGSICDDLWSTSNAEVVCRQLGFEGPTETVSATVFSEGSGRIWLDNVACLGTESDIGNCYRRPYGDHNCGHSEDVGVRCLVGVSRPVEETYDIRLVGVGSNRGRVEMYYHGHWGAICGAEWDITDAEVVCNQLGYEGAIQAFRGDVFGGLDATSLVWLDGVLCAGDETRLIDCTHGVFAPGTCMGNPVYGGNSTYSPVSVVCSDTPYNPINIRLSEGTVELFYNGIWGTICNNSWGIEDAHVVCKSLGYGGALEATTDTRLSSVTLLDNVQCVGTELFVQDCPHSPWGEYADNCDAHTSAGVVCNGSVIEVRLFGGVTPNIGVVQVKHEGVWGTICSQGWNFHSASVVCRQLGMGIAADYGTADDTFTPRDSTTPVWLDNIICYTGYESELQGCEFDGWWIHYCTHDEDVYVNCSNIPEVVKGPDDTYSGLELRGGNTSYEGFVFVTLNGTQGTVCTSDFVEIAQDLVKVICVQLNLEYLNTSFESRDSGLDVTTPVLIMEMFCRGIEQDINSCLELHRYKLCTHQRDLFVSCAPYPYCTPPTAQHPLTVTQLPNPTPIGSVAYFNCSTGFLTGPSQISCHSLQQWLPVGYPSCLPDSCSSQPDTCQGILARLVGGATSEEGNLQVFYNGTWGMVCDRHWTILDANVACKQMGFVRAIIIPEYGEFGIQEENIWLGNVMCVGNESNLLECSHDGIGSTPSCTQGFGVSIVCSDEGVPPLRLQAGVDESQGNIEIYSSHFGVWGHVCDDKFTTLEANVVCQQLGYSGAIRIAEVGEFSSSDSSLSYTLDCTGMEHYVTECQYEEHFDVERSGCEKAGVLCSVASLVAPVRLVGGTTQYEGRVEIWYQGVWGTVCGFMWGVEESDVVCRMLGHSDSGSLPYLLHQDGTGQIWLGDVDCDGDESELVLCRRGTFGEHYCGHDLDVGVVCQPLEREVTLFVRLNGSGVAFEGNLEVSSDNTTWMSVCGDMWNHQSAAVACRQLGYPGVLSVGVARMFEESEYPRVISRVECKGYEELLEDCTNITYTSPVTCEGQASVVCNRFEPSKHYIRLFGGSSIRSGMLQVFYLGEWGAVCDSGWDERDARVVCRDLGFPGVVNPLHRYNVPYVQDDFPSWLSNLGCRGGEERLGDCRNDGWGHHSCTRVKFVGLDCEAEEFPIKLSSDGDSGYIQVYVEDQWGAICAFFWDLKESVIACRQLGYNTALEASYYPIPTNTSTFLHALSCAGNELLVGRCWHSNTMHYTATQCDLRIADLYYHSGSVSGVNCTNEVTTEKNSVRLVPFSENDSYEGYIEVQVGGSWFPICSLSLDVSWNQQAAQVVCRQLGYDGPAEVVYHNSLIPNTGSLQKLFCNGTESNIAECNLSPTTSDCVSLHFYYYLQYEFPPAAVKCYAGVERPASETYDVRLTGGSSRAVGRVEVFYHGRWGVVCGHNWGYTDAVVVCKQLGFVSALQALSSDIFGSMEKSVIVWLDNVACVGDEESLDKCSHDGWGVDQCSVFSGTESADSSTGPASVICSDIPYNNFPISLKGSDIASEGRVEIYYQGQWGTICNKDWGLEEANVTCRSLGYEYALEAVTDGSVFGPGTGRQVLTSLHCLGDEIFLQECSHSPWNVDSDQLDCEHDKDAAVRCKGRDYEVRLVGSDGASGFVEVQYFGVWGRVCNEGFNYPDAKVICRQIGLEYVLDISSGTDNETSSNVPIWLSGLSCYGTEGNIGQCEFVGWGVYQCSHQQDVYVSCTDIPVLTNDIVTVRLLGDEETEGVVEVKVGENPWGTVCTPSVGVSSIAQVICSTLEFPSLNAIGFERTSSYITNNTPISLIDLSCVGTETSLKECYYMTSSESSSLQCTHEQDLYVSCVTADHCIRLQTDPPLQVSEMSRYVPIGFIADFTCSKGSLLGASHIECSIGGVWKLINGAGPAIYPTCSLITCSFFPDSKTYITNTSDTQFPIYTQINVSCNPGNTHPVTNEASVILLCSANGWTPLPANCTDIPTINPLPRPYSANSLAVGGSVGGLILLLVVIVVTVVVTVSYFIDRRKKRLRTTGFATLDNRVPTENVYDILQDESDIPLTEKGATPLQSADKEKLISVDDLM